MSIRGRVFSPNEAQGLPQPVAFFPLTEGAGASVTSWPTPDYTGALNRTGMQCALSRRRFLGSGLGRRDILLYGLCKIVHKRTPEQCIKCTVLRQPGHSHLPGTHELAAEL